MLPRTTSLVEVLAAYLFASTRIDWPGTDGMDLETVVKAHYLAASRAGHVPGLEELKLQHALLADVVDAFFACTHPVEIGV